MNIKLNKLLILTGVGVFLFILMASTSPQDVVLPVLLVPFILIGFITYLLLTSLPLGRAHNNRVTSRIIPVALASLVVILLLLSSLGQLTIRDTLLVIGFGTLFIIYMRRADFLDK